MKRNESFIAYRTYVREALLPSMPIVDEGPEEILTFSEWVEREKIVIDPLDTDPIQFDRIDGTTIA